MDCWEQLRIKPTSDVQAIKKAYAKQLKALGHLDDVSAFQGLREAYEQALLSAKHNKLDVDGYRLHQHNVGMTGVEQALYAVEMIYSDFSQRVQSIVWDNWLLSINGLNKEAKEELSVQLLRFFLDHPFVPPTILKRLSCHFDWIANQWIFYRQYPESLVDRFFGSFKDGPGFLTYDGLQGLPSVNADEYLQRRLEGRHALICNDIRSAIEHLMSAYAIYDADPVLLRLLGCSFELANLLERAKDCFYAGYQLDNDLDFLLRIATIEVKQKNWSQSLNIYTLIFNIDPQNHEAIHGLYTSLLNSNQIPSDEIESALVRLLEAPINERMLILLAEIDFQEFESHVLKVVTALLKVKVSLALGKANEALTTLNQLPAIQDYRLAVWSILFKIKVCTNLNRHADAKHYITYIQQCEEVCTEAKKELVVCYLELGYYLHALNLINIDINDDNHIYLSCRARCNFELANYSDAIKDYQSVLTQLDISANDWFRLGQCYYLVKNYQQALTSFRKCVHIDNANINAKVEIAACLLALNEYQKVVNYINKNDLYRVRFSLRLLWILTEASFGLNRTKDALDYAVQAWEVFTCQSLVRRCIYLCITYKKIDQLVDLFEVFDKAASVSTWWLWHKLIILFLQKQYSSAFDLLKSIESNGHFPPVLAVSIHSFFSSLLYIWECNPSKATGAMTVKEEQSAASQVLLGLAEFGMQNFVAAMRHWVKAKRLLNVFSEDYEQWLLLINHWIVLASESTNMQNTMCVDEKEYQKIFINIYSLLDVINWADFALVSDEEPSSLNICP
ncbi:tetratricopeptide repeat protein [Zooshikella harenae]|uniref:Tetratricopeptide repeat protein n=1 Tax=Zooshikella harenae TaxID=2827238 RepID=A0ABS5Z998_9GAMM|nr:tetratricopeptide repeat protein [Zooshikella harenae]MBU2710564.1 tetratricopeptide repeat protein [Zooshikella harenae]